MSRLPAFLLSTLAFLAVGLLLLTSPAWGQQPPSPSHIFVGNVTVGALTGSQVQGAVVTAEITGAVNNPLLTDRADSQGRYGVSGILFAVPADNPDTAQKDGGSDGDPVVFSVNGVRAEMFLVRGAVITQVASVPFSSGGSDRVNLRVSNTAPTPQTQAVSTLEDTPLSITLVATDPEHCELTFAIVTPPSNGTLSALSNVACSSGTPNTDRVTVTYTPTAEFSGSDFFTFTASDGYLTSSAATASITIGAVNDPPVAQGQAVSTPEDTPKSITLTASDIEGNPLTFSIVVPPSNGALGAVVGNQVTYTPSANFNGNDFFTFKANDGTSDSNTATVSITVTAVNDAPVAQAQAVTTPEDTAATITLGATDVDNLSLTFKVVTLPDPAKGTLREGANPITSVPHTLSGNTVTYVPNLNFFGSDSFTFRAFDGVDDSNIATVSITVTPVNDPPVAISQSVSVAANTSTVITLAATDVEECELIFSVVAPPPNGLLSALSGAACTPGSPNLDTVTVTYTPSRDFVGTDTFTFRANDGTSDSNVATVTITVGIVNTPPAAQAQSVATPEDTPLGITLVGTDSEQCEITFTLIQGPSRGTLSALANAACTPGSPNTDRATVTYTPNLNFFGSDQFAFRVNDGFDDSNIATVSITITPLNDAPVAEAQSVSTLEDTSKTITLAAFDVDGDTLTYSIVRSPSSGTLSTVVGSQVTYTPNANFNGSDSFTFKVNDGAVDSNEATVSITVVSVNDPPVADSQSVSVTNALDITLTGSDVETCELTFSIVQGPTKGTLGSISGLACAPGAPNTDRATVRYTATAGASGSDSFTFRVNDGTDPSNVATVSITVTPVIDAPVANSQSDVPATQGVAKSITLTATDVETCELVFSIVQN
ncbi:MAG: tandem-95 repeat protein, partial [Chloroflexi bacterium]|nr:tandem-95 repeat protein [Chloroflexota bacterium]